MSLLSRNRQNDQVAHQDGTKGRHQNHKNPLGNPQNTWDARIVDTRQTQTHCFTKLGKGLFFNCAFIWRTIRTSSSERDIIFKILLTGRGGKERCIIHCNTVTTSGSPTSVKNAFLKWVSISCARCHRGQRRFSLSSHSSHVCGFA